MIDVFLKTAFQHKTAEELQRMYIQELKKLPNDMLFKLAQGEKLAFGDSAQWLDHFKGSPLFEQAIQLEQESLQLDMADMQQRAMNQEQWQARDQVAMKKRLLELQLAQLEAGQMLPVPNAPAAAPPTAATAPAPQAAPPAAPPPVAPSTPEPAAPMNEPANKLAGDLRAAAEQWGREFAQRDHAKVASQLHLFDLGDRGGKALVKTALPSGFMGHVGALAKQQGGIGHMLGKVAPGMMAGAAAGAAGGAATSEDGHEMRGALKGALGGALLGGAAQGASKLHGLATANPTKGGYMASMGKGIRDASHQAVQEIGGNRREFLNAIPKGELGGAQRLERGLRNVGGAASDTIGNIPALMQQHGAALAGSAAGVAGLGAAGLAAARKASPQFAQGMDAMVGAAKTRAKGVMDTMGTKLQEGAKSVGQKVQQGLDSAGQKMQGAAGVTPPKPAMVDPLKVDAGGIPSHVPGAPTAPGITAAPLNPGVTHAPAPQGVPEAAGMSQRAAEASLSPEELAATRASMGIRGKLLNAKDRILGGSAAQKTMLADYNASRAGMSSQIQAPAPVPTHTPNAPESVFNPSPVAPMAPRAAPSPAPQPSAADTLQKLDAMRAVAPVTQAGPPPSGPVPVPPAMVPQSMRQAPVPAVTPANDAERAIEEWRSKAASQRAPRRLHAVA